MNDVPINSDISEFIEKLARAMPVANFTTSALWAEACWKSTTFCYHPKSHAPPVMGIMFANAEAGKALFRGLNEAYNHYDQFEEMRISIIEGSRPGAPQGYSVHICPEPDALAMHATAAGIVLDHRVSFLGKWNRMYPSPGPLY